MTDRNIGQKPSKRLENRYVTITSEDERQQVREHAELFGYKPWGHDVTFPCRVHFIDTKEIVELDDAWGKTRDIELPLSEFLAMQPVEDESPWISVEAAIKLRIKWFRENYHTFEARKLSEALTSVKSLVPPSMFEQPTPPKNR